MKTLAVVSLDQLMNEYKSSYIPPNLRLLNTATELRDQVINAFDNEIDKTLTPMRRHIRQLRVAESELQPSPSELIERRNMFIGIIVAAWVALLIYVGILIYIYQRTPSEDTMTALAKVQVINSSDERFDVNNI